MKILLVEDNPDDQQLAGIELARLGYRVLAAANGAEALEMFRREQPDVVITDIYMPGMDGFALTQAIQQRAAPRWQPVIFLSGHRDEDLQAKALGMGADAYIVKPVSAALLDAKLQVIARLLAMQRQAEERADVLGRYYAIEEEEKRIARHLMERMVNASKLEDPAVHFWIEAARGFSGDIIAAARTPGNVLHVMLADGTGHGLAASINVLPITPPFYSMTEKGFGIDAIAHELNAKVRQLLPTDRFVAATLASIDFAEGVIRVWNGGNPESVLLDARGHPKYVFSRTNVPLGVLDDHEFDATLEVRPFAAEVQLAMFSDGLLEAEDAQGRPFGFERLAATLVNTESARRLAALRTAVQGHQGGREASDDVSLLLVDCRRLEQALMPVRHAESHPRGGQWHFTLRLSAEELRQVDAVPLLLGLVANFEGARERAGELFVVLSELYNNALDHGLLRLDSRLKLGPGGMGDYLAERQRRLGRLAEGEVEICLEQVMRNGDPWLTIACRDTGPGFGHAGATRPGAGESGDLPFGRGLLLVNRIAGPIDFNETGNRISAAMSL